MSVIFAELFISDSYLIMDHSVTGATQMKPVNCEDLERELMNTTSAKQAEPPTVGPIYTTQGQLTQGQLSQGQFPEPPKVQRVLSTGTYNRIAHSDQYLALSEADRQKLSGFSVDAPEFVPRVITPTRFDLTAPPGAPPGSMPEVTVTVAPIQAPPQAPLHATQAPLHSAQAPIQPVSSSSAAAAGPQSMLAPSIGRGEGAQAPQPTSAGPSPQATGGLPPTQAGLPPGQAAGPTQASGSGPPPAPPPPPPVPGTCNLTTISLFYT